MCSGPVELAAAGVSIALFNQASRITIFPLVSITTSFVAEEDTLEKLKEVIVPEEHMLQHMEKGSLKHSNNISPKPLLQNSESKDPEVKSFGSQALQNNHATRDNHTETGDGNFFSQNPFFFQISRKYFNFYFILIH